MIKCYLKYLSLYIFPNSILSSVKDFQIIQTHFNCPVLLIVLPKWINLFLELTTDCVYKKNTPFQQHTSNINMSEHINSFCKGNAYIARNAVSDKLHFPLMMPNDRNLFEVSLLNSADPLVLILFPLSLCKSIDTTSFEARFGNYGQPFRRT